MIFGCSGFWSSVKVFLYHIPVVGWIIRFIARKFFLLKPPCLSRPSSPPFCVSLSTYMYVHACMYGNNCLMIYISNLAFLSTILQLLDYYSKRFDFRFQVYRQKEGLVTLVLVTFLKFVVKCIWWCFKAHNLLKFSM